MYKFSGIRFFAEYFLLDWEDAIIIYRFYSGSIQNFVHLNFYYFFEYENSSNGDFSYKKRI